MLPLLANVPGKISETVVATHSTDSTGQLKAKYFFILCNRYGNGLVSSENGSLMPFWQLHKAFCKML